MKRPEWFERQFTFGLPKEMLPFYLTTGGFSRSHQTKGKRH